MRPLFYSDYLEGCCPEILCRMQDTNLEQTPGYGCDSHCERAAELIRKSCRKPDAEVHFLVGGTQTNATVLSALLRPHQGAICASTGHIQVHETGAIEHGGHKVLPIESENGGKLSALRLRKLLEEHYSDSSREHMVQPGAVYISFPTELGALYTKQELLAIRQVCNECSIPLFIDGARLGYGLASKYCDLCMEDIADIADVFYIGGTKQGALFGEAVVFPNTKYAKDFRYLIKQGGGMLAKGRLLGIQFETLFDNGLYLKLAERADTLAARLQDAFCEAGYPLLTKSPTNQVFPIFTSQQYTEFDRHFGFEQWASLPDGRTAVRFCTSWATSDENVDKLMAFIGNAKA